MQTLTPYMSYQARADQIKNDLLEFLIQQKRAGKTREAFGSGEVRWGEAEDGPPEAKTLSLDTNKARQVLTMQPVWSLKEAVDRTMNWYRRHHQGENAAGLCREDLEAFEASI
jgi:dTDP-D-glucose 4,6-dehydratase